MIESYNYQPKAYGPMLDAYLAIGWYRLGQYLFTTNKLSYPNVDHEVHWLRYPIDQVKFTRKQNAILNKAVGFNVDVQPLMITDEIEMLYQVYKNNLDFELSPSLEVSLGLDDTTNNNIESVFETYALTIRDQNKLIALGIIDNGDISMAGIINIYDPEYSKYSLGKLLILYKLKLAQDNNKTFFYPGYIGKEYTKFDYKLFIGKDAAEIWDVEQKKWLPYKESKAFKDSY
jgi:leucyl-tRNA---protein transferase